jgi:hypothetical protein
MAHDIGLMVAARMRYQSRILLSNRCQTVHHRAEIRDQPDKPNCNAEFVKVGDHLFVFSHEHYGRPDRMDKHQNYGKHPSTQTTSGTVA